MDVFFKTKTSIYIQFGQSEERKDLVYKIKDLLSSTYKIHKKLLKNGMPFYELKMSSKHFGEKLIEYGCVPNKSSVLQFPYWLPENLMSHFIRGYFDGDGCIWNGKRKYMKFKSRPNGRIIHNVKFTITGTFNLINGIQDYLIKVLNFHKTKLNIRVKDNPNIVTLEYSGKNNIKKFFDFIYKDAVIYCEQKIKKFKEIFCAIDEKSSIETRLIAGTPEMVISSQAVNNTEGSSTIPEMEVKSSDLKCLALTE